MITQPTETITEDQKEILELAVMAFNQKMIDKNMPVRLTIQDGDKNGSYLYQTDCVEVEKELTKADREEMADEAQQDADRDEAANHE